MDDQDVKMEEIKQKLLAGKTLIVGHRFLCYENNEFKIKRLNYIDKKIDDEGIYSDFLIALKRLKNR